MALNYCKSCGSTHSELSMSHDECAHCIRVDLAKYRKATKRLSDCRERVCRALRLSKKATKMDVLGAIAEMRCPPRSMPPHCPRCFAPLRLEWETDARGRGWCECGYRSRVKRVTYPGGGKAILGFDESMESMEGK